MKKLSIPYTKDNKMLDVLGENAKYVREIFMPLPYDVFKSGRPYDIEELERYKSIMDEQIKKAKLMGLEVAMLASKVFLDIDTGVNSINKSSRELIRLKENFDIDKVKISNFAFLKNKGEYLKSNGIGVEISVMADIDTFEKVDQIMTLYPFVDCICLHNTFIFMLDDIKYIKAKYPKLELKIMVNHGCLINCASHAQHHDMLSSMTYKMDTNDHEAWRLASNSRILHPSSKICETYCMSETFNPLRETAHIRPEDLHYYDDVIDIFKISGREQPAERFVNIIKAYGERTYDGDIRNLLDMPYDMPYIDNTKFQEDYMEHKLNCNHKCYKCNYCDEIAKDVIDRNREMDKPPSIEHS